MINESSNSSSQKMFNYSSDAIFLKRIPNEIHQKMVNLFSTAYHFKNGEQMQISNYFVGIHRSLSDSFVDFINETINGLVSNQLPNISTPEGFKPHPENLLPVELNGSFSLGSFDMAVTNEGLQNIEFQSVATYPISAAKLNQCLLDNLSLENAFIFADDPKTNWQDFIHLYEKIIGGNEKEGIILTDRKIAAQKTNFEFFATQQELNIPIEIVDMENLFEKEDGLFYSNSFNPSPQKVKRFYNRILLAEALFEDNYPHDGKMWQFRFDKKYDNLKFVNHPIKQFEVSKRLSPYINHPFNPDCYELAEVVEDFKNGRLKYQDFVWKHKWGAAGHRLILSPNEAILDSLTPYWKDYIAQKKVHYRIFKTDDNQEKIVELRFMTAIQDEKMIIVPMARLGHIETDQTGNIKYKIHFGDNNKAGYGFSPVVIFED